MIGAALQAVERFVLPNACVACGRVVETAAPDSLVCGPCRSRLRPVPPGCERCRQPLPPVGPCRFCADWPDGFSRATSAVWLGEEARELVHHLKYEGYTKLGVLAATTIASQTLSPPATASLVPVPLGGRRRLDRGYNQAAEIGRALADIWSLPLEETVIRRRRETRSQTTLTPEERVKNMRGVFEAILPHSRGNNTGKIASPTGSAAAQCEAVTPRSNIAILVDDVLTTGATLASAAAALLDAGWTDVRAVTFARALPFAVCVETQR
ncbi:ComF family protein [Gemmatimonadota bacterium]